VGRDTDEAIFYFAFFARFRFAFVHFVTAARSISG
jgi:hypothetical protein